MSSPWTSYRECAKTECTARFAHHMWGKIRAQNAGWFEQRDGTVWCPDHLPEWLNAWRARKGNQ